MAEENSSLTTALREEAFAFVRSLANELSEGKVELPCFPEVALKVRRALDDESVTVARIATILGAEAGLAARVLVMANSAALGYSGKPVTDLHTAVTRIGLSNVRTAALAFALGQLRRAVQFKHIMQDLERFWRQSTKVAALGRVLALRIPGVNADLAMLAGLLHNIGAVYILARAGAGAGVIRQTELREMLLKDWSATIGRSIAENWGLQEEVVEAIGQQFDVDRARRGSADLSDVQSVAVANADQVGMEQGVDSSADFRIALGSLGLDESSGARIIEESNASLAALQAALSG
jgi:HD-like signal output (HDOD) protein